ncbi:TPA: replication initiation protein, partial [Pseudomonas aeruginosa]
MHKCHKVTKSNSLIAASYRLTLNEHRLVLAAISQIDPRKPLPRPIRVCAHDFAELY